MDWVAIEKRLALVEKHIIEGEQYLIRQRLLIERLERKKHDTLEARRFLAQFEEMQADRIANRDRLRKELTKVC